MARIDDEVSDIGSRTEADEADILEQDEVAVSDDILDEEADGERETDDE